MGLGIVLLLAQQPLDLLPQPALAVAVWEAPGETVRSFRQGELWRRVEASGIWAGLSSDPRAALAAFAWAAVSAPVGGDAARFAEAFAGGGVAAAWVARDGAEPGIFAASRMGDPDLAEACLVQIARLARLDAEAVKGERWSLPLGDAFLARDGAWLFLASDADWIGSTPPPATGHADGVLALRDRATRGPHPANAWAWVSGAAMRANGFAPLPADLGASLLAADLHEALRVGDWAGLTLRVGSEGLRAELIVPEPATLVETHAPFRPGRQSISLPNIGGSMLRGVMVRDFGAWYNARDLYASAAAVAGSIEGDGNARLLFGRDFGPDVLAWLEPQLRVLSARNPDAASRALDVELPAGAIGLRLKPGAPDGLRQGFVNAFLAAVTFSNFQAGAADEKQLLLGLESVEADGTLYVARRPSLADGARAPLAHNAEPALYVGADGEVWIGSSVGLLREILSAPRESFEAESSWVEARLGPVAALIEAARGAIVARRLLQAGGDFAAAERFADLVLAGSRLLDGATVRLGPADGFCTLQVELRAEAPEIADAD